MKTEEAGWTPDQWGHSRFKSVNASGDSASNQKSWTAFMRSLLKVSFDILSPMTTLYLDRVVFVSKYIYNTLELTDSVEQWSRPSIVMQVLNG